MQPHHGLIDIDNNAAIMPGTGSGPVHFTYSYDVAKYTAALFALPKWEQNYYVAGGIKTWKEVVEVIERAKGVKFVVVCDSVENLEKGEINDMPGQRQSGDAGDALGGENNKERPRRMMVMFRLWFTQGMASECEGVFLNEVAPEVEPLTLEKAWNIHPHR